MLERYRSIGPPLVVLVCFALALIAASAARNDGDQSNRGRKDAYAADHQAAPVFEPAVVGLFPPKNRPEAAYQTYETEQYDLVAQRWMAWLTGLIVLFTGIGIFLLFLTLRDTRKILDEARETTTAARDATRVAQATADITREIGERQLRPYILFDSAENQVWTSSTGHKTCIAEICFKNCGQNPGIVTARTAVVHSPRKSGGWGWVHSLCRKGRVVIGPGQTSKFSFSAIDADDQGRFTWYQIGVLLIYEDQKGTPYEDHIWLTFDLREFRQDYDRIPAELFRPEQLEKNQQD